MNSPPYAERTKTTGPKARRDVCLAISNELRLRDSGHVGGPRNANARSADDFSGRFIRPRIAESSTRRLAGRAHGSGSAGHARFAPESDGGMKR